MNSDVHHRRSFLWIVLLALLALMLFARPAHSGWSLEPVEIHATNALCPLVATVDDGNNGALIVWQENTASGGLLRAKHVLASGDIDPGSITPAAVSSQDVSRAALGAVSDGDGGAYVWWMENTQLMLTRLTGTGAVAPGWLARGRNLGTLFGVAHRPIAVADGAGGLYVGWLNSAVFGGATANIRIQHLGASGSAAGGWPAGGRAFGLIGTNPSVVSFGLDRAADGGLWLAWQTMEQLFEGAWGVGDERLLRLSPAGLPAAGWTSVGVALSPCMPLAPVPSSGQFIALASDGADGMFVADALSGGITDPGVLLRQTLRHIDGSGAAFGTWDPAGVDLGFITAGSAYDFTAPASMRAFPDGRGGVYVGAPWFASEFTAMLNFSRFGDQGAALPGGIGTNQNGMEFALRSDGGMFIASFKPSGATGPFESDAYISVGQSDGAAFFESKPSFYATRYGDVGLTATRDGGAIFAWSQLIDRQGVYAIRLNPAGAVTGVNPSTGAASLRLRFVRGQGVLAVPSLPGAASVTLALHDLAGRVVSSVRTDGTPGADVMFPGTRDLPGGVYFARASAGGQELHARVVVIH